MSDNIHKTLKMFDDFLQQNVTFSIGPKTVRKGKLMLYNINDYYIRFIIKTNKDLTKTYEIPYPFKIHKDVDGIHMSYTIDDLCNDNKKKVEFIEEELPESPNKLFNNTLILANIN
jgi:hypothetical protein